MGLNSLPNGLAYDHIAAGQAAAYGIGDGMFDTLSCTFITVDGVRRLRLNAGNQARFGIPAATKLVVGFYYSSSGGEGHEILQFRSGGTLDFNLHRSGGSLEIRRGTTVLATVTTANLNSGTRYIEIAVHLDNSGSYELRYNGVVVAEASGVDTTVSGGSADQIRMITNSSFLTQTQDYGPIHIKEWDGPSEPGFKGIMKPRMLLVDSDGATLQWTPDTGTEHFSRLNEATIDDDSSYVEEDTVGEVDELGLENAPVELTDDIPLVTQFAVGVAPAGGAPTVDLGLKRLTSEDYESGLALGGSYGTVARAATTQPDGSPWTKAAIDALSFLLRR